MLPNFIILYYVTLMFYRYPMLLDRLYKATPSKHEDKDAIKEAKEKIEDILGHINAVSYLPLAAKL